MAQSCPLLKALTDGEWRTVEVQGHSWISVARVLNTMQPNFIYNYDNMKMNYIRGEVKALQMVI